MRLTRHSSRQGLVASAVALLPTASLPAQASLRPVSATAITGPDLPAGARSADVTLADGMRLHYVVAGPENAPPVVLLHGLTDTWFSFSRVLPALATRFRVYALDQRGHGDSDRPASGYTMPEMAGDVVAFLDALRIERAVVVGHSMGSFVARNVARRAPARVSRLVLVGSGVAGANENTRELTAMFAPLPEVVPADFAREWQLGTIAAPVPDDFMDTVVRECQKAPARVWRAGLAGLLDDAPATAANAPAMPTLLVSGDLDAPFPVVSQDALARTWPEARLLRYPGIGHTPQWETPDRFARDVLAFLSR